MGKLLIIVGLLVLPFILQYVIRKRLDIEPQKGLYKHVNETHKWIEYLVILPIIFAVPILKLLIFNSEISLYFVVVGFGILFIFRTYMEWRYDKESKQYILQLVNGFSIILLSVGLILLFSPKEISTTYPAILFTEDGAISEEIEIEINGKLSRHILDGERFHGELSFLERDFLTVTFGRRLRDRTIEHLFDQRYYYTIVGSGTSERGNVWTSQEFQSVAGKIDHANLEGIGENVDIMFAGPASSLEEAQALYEKLYAGEN